MARMLACAACLAAMAISACSGAPSGAGEAETRTAAASAAAPPSELDVENVAARLAGGEDIFLLDVRTSEELARDGVISGYTHIPIDELESRFAEVPRDKPVVAY